MAQRYSKEGTFDDPVVRCCECSRIIFRDDIRKFGCCPSCGNRRMRNVLNMTGEEMDTLKIKGIDDSFLSLFEGVTSAG